MLCEMFGNAGIPADIVSGKIGVYESQLHVFHIIPVYTIVIGQESWRSV